MSHPELRLIPNLHLTFFNTQSSISIYPLRLYLKLYEWVRLGLDIEWGTATQAKKIKKKTAVASFKS